MMHRTYVPERQRIAIQKKGRLFEASMDFLLARGLSFPQNGRSLIVSSENADIDLIYLRDDDIPEYVSRGVADFGIVGENVLAEKGAGISVVAKLGFGECTLMIAVPEDSRIQEHVPEIAIRLSQTGGRRGADRPRLRLGRDNSRTGPCGCGMRYRADG